MGQAVIPAGRLGPGSTITQVVTLSVQAEKFFMGSNFTQDFAAGNRPLLILFMQFHHFHACTLEELVAPVD